MTPTINHLPLHDETSGIANLDARRRRERRWIDAGATLALGMVLGALICTAIFLFIKLN